LDKTKIVIILVGNKSDLVSERVNLFLFLYLLFLPVSQMVETKDGQKLADHYEVPFFEVSAKDNINLTEVFQLGAEEHVKRHPVREIRKPLPVPSKSNKCC
jgi:GTPase SAR1 family protein